MAGFFLPLTGEDETHPLCQGLPLSGKTSPGRGKMSPTGDKKGNQLSPQATERVRPCKQTLSVTAFGRATSPERERLWQGRKVYSLTVDFFLPLTNEDETHPLCQGLPPSGELAPQATERVRPESIPLPAGD